MTSHAAAHGSTRRANRGQRAAPPGNPERPGIWRVLKRVWNELGRDNVSMMAAGVAFYSFLAMFPGISAAISLYGLIADRVEIERHLQVLAGVLPAEALNLITTQVHQLVTAPPTKLGIGLVISVAFALWSAMNAASMLMTTLTVAYEERDDRSLLSFYTLALALTLGLIGFGFVALALVAGIPAVLASLPFRGFWTDAVAYSRWLILAGLLFVGLALLYRLAPQRPAPKWEWLAPGTIAAALLWLLVSAGFSLYVASFNSYDKTYGSIGAVVVLLMWFYLTAYVILAGAELNCEWIRARQLPHSGVPNRLPETAAPG